MLFEELLILIACSFRIYLYSEFPTLLPSLPLQEQRVRLCGDHRTPPQLFTELPRQLPTTLMTVRGSGSSDPQANKAIMKQEVVSEQWLTAQCKALVGSDQAP